MAADRRTRALPGQPEPGLDGPEASQDLPGQGADTPRAATGVRARAAHAHQRSGITAIRKYGRPVQPLLSLPARRPAAITLAGCAVIAIVIAALVAHTSGPDAVDRAVDSWIRGGLSAHARILGLVHDLGETVQATIITAAIAVASLAARRLNGAILVVVSVPLAVVLTEVAKHLVRHTLGGYPDYPSGHTTVLFAMATSIAILLVSPPHRRPPAAARVTLVVIASLVGCAVGVAMIGLGFHYFTDTVGGAAVGTGVVLAMTFLLDSRRIRGWLA
ncbi:MAG TPA: phosphatase PAP2 family protein [Streptosporangiaceae bacterium]